MSKNVSAISTAPGVGGVAIIRISGDKSKEILFYCTCPCEFYCEHMYLVIKAIRKTNQSTENEIFCLPSILSSKVPYQDQVYTVMMVI